MSTSNRVPVYGDTVYFTTEDGNQVKGQVIDVTARKDGKIKVLVIPSDNSPFPVFAKYSDRRAAGTWNWDEPKAEDAPEAKKED